MKRTITRWTDGAVLYECEAESLRHAVEIAVANRANLDGANLYGANLTGANLYGASLYGANLDGANLYGANLDAKPIIDIIQLSGIGSSRRMTTVIITAESECVRCGCFHGDMAQFSAQIESTHANNPKYLAQYRAAVEFLMVCIAQARKDGAK